jgi:hypothetical protein
MPRFEKTKRENRGNRYHMEDMPMKKTLIGGLVLYSSPLVFRMRRLLEMTSSRTSNPLQRRPPTSPHLPIRQLLLPI